MLRRCAAAITAAFQAVSARRAVVLGVAVGVPASALFLWLALRSLDLGAAFDAMGAADPLRMALAVGALCSVYAVQAARWRWIARRDSTLSTRRYLSLVVSAIACNNVIPGRPGDALRAHWLGRAAEIPRSRALGTVVADRAADLLALVLLLGVGYAAVGHDTAWTRRLAAAAVTLAAVTVLVLLAARTWHDRLRAGAAASRLRAAASEVVATVGKAVNPRDAAVAASLALAAWALWGLGAWLVAGALGIELGLFEVASLTAIVNLGVAIPSSPGFVGTYQWLCVSSLALLGVAREEGFAFSVLLHASWFVPSTVAGLALLVAGGSARALEGLRTKPQAGSA
jgi:uncharacterized protein (TIRG00374 family)